MTNPKLYIVDNSERMEQEAYIVVDSFFVHPRNPEFENFIETYRKGGEEALKAAGYVKLLGENIIQYSPDDACAFDGAGEYFEVGE